MSADIIMIEIKIYSELMQAEASKLPFILAVKKHAIPAMGAKVKIIKVLVMTASNGKKK